MSEWVPSRVVSTNSLLYPTPYQTTLESRWIFFALMEYKTWMCVICGFVYDEELGLPEEGLAPGTRWADIPENWQCPDCDATKIDFEMIEI